MHDHWKIKVSGISVMCRVVEKDEKRIKVMLFQVENVRTQLSSFSCNGILVCIDQSKDEIEIR